MGAIKAHYDCIKVFSETDFTDDLSRVDIPVLVMHGEDDPLLPVECGRDVARLVPAAKIETFAGWGHDLPAGFLPTLIDRIAGFCKGK